MKTWISTLTAIAMLGLWLAGPAAVAAGQPATGSARAPAAGPEPQADAPAWVIWETEAPVQRLALEGETVWAGHYKGGLSRWDVDRGFEGQFSVADGMPGEDVLSIAVDDAGQKWLALLDGSVARTVDGASFANLTPPPPADTNAWALAAGGGEVWLATLGGGVARRSGGAWTAYTSTNSNLPFDDVYAIAAEPGGGAWMGTIGYGVAAFDGTDWVHYDPPLMIPQPLDPGQETHNAAITAIAVDGSGNKWFASDGSGVAVLDAANANWTIHNSANSGLPSDFVQSIFVDAQGNRWFGTLGGGVSRLSADGSAWISYHSANSPLPEDDVLDVVVDGDGGLWLAAYDAGLAFFGDLPATPPAFDLDPRGAPDFVAGASRGYYLWLDLDSFEWHLAWAGDGQEHTFEGEIVADGGLDLLDSSDLEPGDEVTADAGRLTVRAQEATGQDRVSFGLGGEVTELTVRLRIDGAYYPFSLRVGAAGSKPGTAPFRIQVPQPQPPLVEAGEDLAVTEGAFVFLSGSFSDPDSPSGHLISWDLGDGTVIEGSLSPSHVYLDDGDYQAVLSVSDVHGVSGADSLLVTVANAPPEVDFFNEPFLPNAGETVAFEALVFDPGQADTHTFTWDFSDGSDPVTGDQPTIEHVYDLQGDYPVTLTVSDDDGGAGSASFVITVIGNQPPVVDAGEDLTGQEGTPITQSASLSDPDSSAWTAEVDWGDGGPVESIEIAAEGPFDLTHMYEEDGVYQVTVHVSDDMGASGSDQFTATIENVAPSVSAVGDAIDEGGTATIQFSFSDPGTADTHTASIDWGDGSAPEEMPLSLKPGSANLTASHVYGDDGEYSVTVTVVDDDGGTGTASAVVAVANLDPQVGLDSAGAVALPGGDAFFGRVGETQTHRAEARDPGSDDLTFNWNSGSEATYFNNGESPDPDPSPDGVFPFEALDEAERPLGGPGLIMIEVRVSDDDGGSASDSLHKLVTGTAACTRSQGFWKHQFSGQGQQHVDEPTLSAYLDLINFASALFSEGVPASTLQEAAAVMQAEGNEMRPKAQAQLLAAWLNFAHGAVGWDEPIDTGVEGIGSAPFYEVASEAEAVLLDPQASHEALVRAKDLAEAINQLDKGQEGCEAEGTDSAEADQGVRQAKASFQLSAIGSYPTGGLQALVSAPPGFGRPWFSVLRPPFCSGCSP